MVIRQFTDQPTIEAYRSLRWQVFRAPHGLPRGSEIYDGEEKGMYVGAFEDDELIGGVLLIDRGLNSVQMHHLVVEETHRKQGVSIKLIEEFERIAKERGVKTVYAHARTYVLPLYTKVGYRALGAAGVPSTLSDSHAPGVPHEMYVKEL